MAREDPLKVAFLLAELGRSGGVAVVLRHARLLRERAGMEVEIVMTGAGAAGPQADPGALAVISLAEASGRDYDVAIATWWETAEALWSVRAARRAMLLQNVEHRFYPADGFPDRAAAAGVLFLPIAYISVSAFMDRLMGELRPDAPRWHVPVGIDKEVFGARPPAAGDGSLRVLVEGQPTLWFKGVEDAVAAVRAMREPATVTVAVHDPSSIGELDADRVVGGLGPTEMAELYASHDVVLKMPRFEGLGLPPLEAFHVGRPCVVTPYTGHEEYVEHGVNGLVVPFDDRDAAARALDALAADAALRERLAAGALATAESWPGPEASSAALAEVLRALVAAPAPAPERALDYALLDRRMWTELARGRELQRRGALAWREHELADTRAELDRVNASRDAHAELLGDTRRELEEVRAERAYRLAAALRRRLPGRRA